MKQGGTDLNPKLCWPYMTMNTMSVQKCFYVLWMPNYKLFLHWIYMRKYIPSWSQKNGSIKQSKNVHTDYFRHINYVSAYNFFCEKFSLHTSICDSLMYLNDQYCDTIFIRLHLPFPCHVTWLRAFYFGILRYRILGLKVYCSRF